MHPLYRLDQEIFRTIHVGLHREWLDWPMKIVTDTGLFWVEAIILVLIAVWRPARTYAVGALVSGGLTGLAANLLKGVVPRQRPSVYEFSQPLEQFFGNNSFPSGHTATAFGVAVMVAWMVRGTEYAGIGWAAFFWACLVGFSRVYVGVHFLSDVLGGAAIGAIGATLFYLLWKKRGWLPARAET